MLMLAIGLLLGGAVGVIIMSLCVMSGKNLEYIEQRNELVRLSTDIVRECQFVGYAFTTPSSIGKMRKYLEAIR